MQVVSVGLQGESVLICAACPATNTRPCAATFVAVRPSGAVRAITRDIEFRRAVVTLRVAQSDPSPAGTRLLVDCQALSAECSRATLGGMPIALGPDGTHVILR